MDKRGGLLGLWFAVMNVPDEVWEPEKMIGAGQVVRDAGGGLVVVRWMEPHQWLQEDSEPALPDETTLEDLRAALERSVVRVFGSEHDLRAFAKRLSARHGGDRLGEVS